MIKASEVYPGLWVRGRLNRGWTREHLLAQLHETGIETVISVYPGGEPRLVNSEINYYHAPFHDNTRDSVNGYVVRAAVVLAVDSVRAGFGTLVTCKRGRNRSGLVVALALLELTGDAPSLVLERLRALRPMTPPVLSNPAFEAHFYKCAETLYS